MSEPKPAGSFAAWAENYERLSPEEKQKLKQDSDDHAKQMLAAAEREIYQNAVRSSGCPPRLLELAVERDGRFGKWTGILNHLLQKMGETKGVLAGLCGVRGNGKSLIGVELVRAALTNRRAQCYFASATSVLMRFKECYQTREQTERSIMHDLTVNKTLVVIDEIGKRSESDWENRLLYELINQRYENLKHTLVISNHNIGEFKDALGPSLASRMIESGGIIECNWESFRG